MLRDWRSHKDYSQELLHFNWKWLEKLSVEKHQPYQPKLVVVETVDPKRTHPKPVSRNFQFHFHKIPLQDTFYNPPSSPAVISVDVFHNRLTSILLHHYRPQQSLLKEIHKW